MGELPIQKNTYSIEEYLALEEKSEARYEYHQGEVVAMAGATVTHNEITGNLYMKLRASLSGGSCRTFMENVKLEMVKDVFYAYPDVMVTCDASDLDDNLIQRFPILIAEVSSSSTQIIDRVTKLRRYRQTPALKYYLLVDEYDYWMELYTCQDKQQNTWFYQDFNDLEEEIDFPELDLKIKLSEIYQGITLTQDNTEDATNPQE
ncbi:MAG TPA: hypothetical protein DCS93_16405 [Microscillaceae bacterium]|nr:hypothetical protein [Microscillaceae bacterium]